MWVRFEEATMAAITFDIVCRRMQLPDQLKSMLSICRNMLDAFASNRLRHAAAEAEHVRPRQHQSTPPDAPAGQTQAPAVRFEVPAPDVLSEAIPAFFIGRNKAGLWVAREARGRTGGIFLLKSSAIAFAHTRSGVAGFATIFPDERFELDIANGGNPLATRFGELVRLAKSLWL
jgi:hypothetical protein